MKRFALMILVFLMLDCSKNKCLDKLVEKQADLETYVDSLKSTELVYQECTTCRLDGLEEGNLKGITDRYPPYGNFDHKEVELGVFEYDTYQVFTPDTKESSSQLIYFCFLDENQKTNFESFMPFYINRITHFKQKCRVQFINNTAVISIENLI